jgi:DNA-directed RNA polymerase specialized sigma subunit
MTCADCPLRDSCTVICQSIKKLLPGLEKGSDHNGRDLKQVIRERAYVRRILDFEDSARLSQGQREIINLYYRQNMDTIAIANRLGITTQAVSDRLRKLHTRLANIVAKY